MYSYLFLYAYVPSCTYICIHISILVDFLYGPYALSSMVKISVDTYLSSTKPMYT